MCHLRLPRSIQGQEEVSGEERRGRKGSEGLEDSKLFAILRNVDKCPFRLNDTNLRSIAS